MLSRVLPVVLIAVACAPPALAASAQPAIPDRPLSLAECTAIALAKNPQMASAAQSVVGARAALTRARSTYYPQVSVDAVEGLTSTTSSLSPGGGTSAFGSADRREDLDLALRQTFWQRGRRESVQEARSPLRGTQYDYAGALQSLIEGVARDYYAVLAATQLVSVAEEGVDSARSHLDEVKARITQGLAAEVDVYPAEDDLARAQLDLIDARSNLRLALAGLKNTMGLPPDTSLQLAPAPPPQEIELPSLDQALDTALAARPDLLAAQAGLEGARSALQQARIRRGPVADVSGQYSQGYTEWQARDPSWDLLLSVSLPLFDGHATRADEISAQARLARSQADRQRLVNQIGLDVENALVEVERTRERVAASEASVTAANARLAAAEGKYRQGRAILIEVTDARVAVTTARVNQVRARYDHQTALVGFERALGTLRAPQQEGEANL